MTDPSKPADPSARPVRRPRGLCPVCRQERHLRAGGTLGQHNRLTRQGYNIGVCSGVDLPALTEGPEPMPDPTRPVKRAVLHISMQTIHQFLQLPDDVEVLHIAPGHYGLSLAAVITHPGLPETDPASLAPELFPTYEVVDGRSKLVDLGLDALTGGQ